MAKPVLTLADIDLLKKVFATKDDLNAVKEELKNFTKEQLEEFSIFLKGYFEHIKLEGSLQDHEKRIKQIEDVTPGLPS